MYQFETFTLAVINMLQGTPWWAYIIFISLLLLGIREMKARTTFFPTIFILPAILLVVSTCPLLMNYKLHSMEALYYLATLLAGAVIGWLFCTRAEAKFNKAKYLITLPGTNITFLAIIILFAIHYYFGHMRATHPFTIKKYALLEVIAFSAIAGVFLGSRLRYLYKFIKS